MKQQEYFRKHLLKNKASGFDLTVQTQYEENGELKRGKWKQYEGQEEQIDERQVFPNEVVIDIDAEDSETAKKETRKVKTILEGEGVPLLVADTGGTGFHIHIFFRYEGLDSWKDYREYRIALFEFLKGLCEEEENSPDTDLWDRGLVDFDFRKGGKGHLVRAIGGRKIETGNYKTTVSSLKKQEITDSEDVEYPARVPHLAISKFSKKQGLFTVQEVQEKVEELREEEREREEKQFSSSNLEEEAESLQEIRDLPASEVLKLVGEEASPGEMIKCPFHDDTNPSGKVTDGSEGAGTPEDAFICFADSCITEEDRDRGSQFHYYNAIDILTEESRDFKEAVSELIEEFNLDIDESEVLGNGSSSESNNTLLESDSDKLVVTEKDTEALSEILPECEVVNVEQVDWSTSDYEKLENFDHVYLLIDSLSPDTWEQYLCFHSRTEMRPEIAFYDLDKVVDEEELTGVFSLEERAGELSGTQQVNALKMIGALYHNNEEIIKDSVAKELKESTGRKKSSIEDTMEEFYDAYDTLDDSEDDEISIEEIIEVCRSYNYLRNDWGHLYAVLGDENPELKEVVNTMGVTDQFKRNVKSKLRAKYGHIPKIGKIKNAIDEIIVEKMDKLQQVQLRPRIDRDRENERLIYDLANSNREAVEITLDGWEKTEKPIHMKKFPHMKAQVMPERDGEYDIDDFMELMNPELSEDMKMLLKVQVIANFYPGLNHPIIFFSGAPGSGKSTAHGLIKELVDPSRQEGLPLEGDENDDAIKFYKHYLPVFDNLSKITQETSDLLCKAVTGGSISKRALYTDMDSIEFGFQRPIGLNGLQNLTAENSFRDLAERTIIYDLPPISPENRKRERDSRNNEERIKKVLEISDELSRGDIVAEEGIMDRMDEIKASVLGHVFDVLSEAMMEQFRTKVPDQHAHRLKDFQEFGEAIARVLGYPEGKFSRKFKEASEENKMDAEKTSSLVKAILNLIDEDTGFQDKRATDLLNELRDVADRENIDKDEGFPPSVNHLKPYIERKEDVLNSYHIAYRTKKKGGYTKHTLEWDNTVKEQSNNSLKSSRLKKYLEDNLDRRDDTLEIESIAEELNVNQNTIENTLSEEGVGGFFIPEQGRIGRVSS